MCIYSLYFSPTGGTKKAANMILNAFRVDDWIDLSDFNEDYSKYSFVKGDTCFISVPSYGGRVPQVALERLRKMRVDRAYAVLVVSYGNRAYDDTLLELKNETEKIGFFPVGAVAAVTEHSIVRKCAAGRPDNKDKAELEEYSRKLKDMFDLNGLKRVTVPGSKPYRHFPGFPLKPSVNENCIKCGLCARSCPVSAICFDNPSKTDNNKCISCMRCVSICPQNARSLSKAGLFATEQKLKKLCSQRKSNELFLGDK